ncbi:MAG: flagellar biosynthesis protein FlhB [Alphaproteobacteria bacterium]|nr:flagellar biosynthesis protein FlhB [Alphaproteobacteria bacterium]MBV9692360.1 flagellar biosynthesis protein FlhB [Alphaproteobacteria bacterium]
MAEEKDRSTQTEEPTQKRLAEAREHGDVVKSAELSTLVVLGAGTIAIAIFGHSIALQLAATMRAFLEQPEQMDLSGSALEAMAHGLLGRLLLILGPLFATLVLAGLGGNLIQHPPVFTFERIKPDLSKLSLGAGFKRMFGMEGLTTLAKGLFKIAIVGAAIWTQVWPERGKFESALSQTPLGIASDMSALLFKVLIATLAALAVIAVADYWLQRLRFIQRNRMSKQEIKEEFRQTEGDPTVKAKIRQLRQERSRRRMIAAVPQATVVIANPTHFAVALQYESGKTAAPICVAKGVDALALRIRAVAEEHGVPVVENPPLARALHGAIEVDQPIPPEHYKAVAQIIGYVMKLNGNMRTNPRIVG